MKRIVTIFAAALLLGACTQQQLQTAQTQFLTVMQNAPTEVQSSCAGANQASAEAQGLLKGGANATLSSFTVQVDAACNTASGLAKIAADPTSIAWLKALTDGINSLIPAPKGTVPATPTS